MDTSRFDTVARRVGSRRSLLAAALGGMPFLTLLSDASARKRKKRCRRIKYKLRLDFCGAIRTNTCGGKRQITCLAGKTCMANQTCGLTCTSAAACPTGSGCTCSTNEPKVCLAAFTTCGAAPTTCATTADCPAHTSCEETLCGAGGASVRRCLPLCGYALAP